MRFEIPSSLSPPAAFAAAADFERLEEWDPAVTSSRLIAGTALTPGAVYQLETPGWLGKKTLTYELVAINSPVSVTYRGGTKLVTSTDSFQVLPAGSGSRLILKSDMEMTGWARWAAPAITGLVWLAGRTLSLPALRRRLR